MEPFSRLSISGKVLLGYVTLVAIIFLISAYTLSSLERLNSVSGSIMDSDMPFIETSDKMVDNLLSQELYARRYAIIRSPATLALFQEKSKEFNTLMDQFRSLPQRNRPDNQIISAYTEYHHLLETVTEYPEAISSSAAEIRNRQEAIIGLIKGISSRVREEQIEKALAISRIGAAAFRVTAALCFFGVLLSIIATVAVTRSIAGPIYQIKEVTQEIAAGKFDRRLRINNHDEFGELSHAFNEMADRLIHLEKMHLDASPLTRLPGSSVIETVLKERLEGGVPLAFCFLDLDNFKAFNDRYGYARGSEVIKATAALIEQKVAECGTPDDFIGHVGGDDFVVITTHDRYRAICTVILEAFDAMIPDFYDEEERGRGYIAGKTRNGDEARFPIMSISIAVVTNEQHKLSGYLEVGEIIADLKKYAKTLSGSVCVVDRRGNDWCPAKKSPGNAGWESDGVTA